MTLNEFKNIVAGSGNYEWFQKYEIQLEYSHIDFNTTIKSVVNIYEFILNQIEGFEKKDRLPEELLYIKNRFIDVRDNIESLVIANNASDWHWQSNLERITNDTPPIFLFNSPETDFLIQVNIENPQFYNGAYEFLTGETSRPTNKNYFFGYLLAYEFVAKDFSKLVERKNSEKKSIASIRAEFQKSLNDAEIHLTEYLAQAKQRCDENAVSIEEFKNAKGDEFYEWYDKAVNDFNQFNTSSNKSVKDLEELYKAKLKLEAPAKYWNERAKKLRKEGYLWLGAVTVCVCVAIWILIWILNKISDASFVRIFSETGTAVKWSVALITLISFLAYAIRVFSKLTFSSFHLVRDAEEREQLTYVYLALQKEKGIDQTERHLIMQSLFSRADSGLLKDDASPTMPGNIVDQITKK